MRRKKVLDQRKLKRFRAREGAFAVLKDNASKLGQIIDVCAGGLAFRYVDVGNLSQISFHELDIFLAENGFCLKEVPFRVISELEMDNGMPFSSVIMRRLGVQFGELTQAQRDMLDYFIRYHTLGEV